MSDLLERLDTEEPSESLIRAAKKEIERLQAEVSQKQEALEAGIPVIHQLRLENERLTDLLQQVATCSAAPVNTLPGCYDLEGVLMRIPPRIWNKLVDFRSWEHESTEEILRIEI